LSATNTAGAALLRAARTSGEYRRHRPEASALHQVVRENLLTLYAAIEHGLASDVPKFVRDELEGYLDCGLLCRGFALMQCENPECREKKLVAFSCKGRGFCPACLGRRMAEAAANLVDHVLPRVPLRQFVFTVPFELRARLAYDAKLLGAVGRIFVDSVLGFYRRTLREVGVDRGESGAVTVVQRCSADLRLNPHFHSLALDGVFAPSAAGELEFHALPSLSNQDVAELLHTMVARVLAWLERQGVIASRDEPMLLADESAEHDPALSALAAAAVAGVAPAGPERRARPAIALRNDSGLRIVSGLSAAEAGFSLHAATTAPANDVRAREALCKYILRPPLAQERVHLLDDGLVRIELKRPFADGTVAVDLDPLSLLCRLAAAVPAPGFHVIRYAGVLASAHHLRALVVPPPSAEDETQSTTHLHPAQDRQPPTHRCRYRPWAELMKRAFGWDVDHCDNCGARLRLRALVSAAASVERFLRHIGEPIDPPPLSPARGPPFFQSRVLRRKLGELELARGRQTEMRFW
jgi:hypothetical protein